MANLSKFVPPTLTVPPVDESDILIAFAADIE